MYRNQVLQSICFYKNLRRFLEKKLPLCGLITLQYLIEVHVRLFFSTKKSTLYALIRYLYVIFYVMPKKSYVITATLIFQNFPPYNAYSILYLYQIVQSIRVTFIMNNHRFWSTLNNLSISIQYLNKIFIRLFLFNQTLF